MDITTFLLPITFYTFIMCITPGTNNNYLLSAGSIFQYKQCIPYILGTLTASAVVFLLVGFGLGHIFKTYPFLELIFKIIGTFIIIYIAYMIYKNAQIDINKKVKNVKVIGFVMAFIINTSNIKIWICAMTGISSYIPSDEFYLRKMLIFILISTITGLFTLNLWTLGGVFLKRFTPKTVSVINKIFAFLLLGTIIFIYI